ncbi:MAG: hypothetical protein K6L81_03225 [Agarilytica sp.]
MSTIKIKPELLHALVGLQGKSFTVDKITKYYLEQPESLHSGKKPARQFVYRNMIRMMKLGLMEKLPDDGGWPKYRLTRKFSSEYTPEPKTSKNTQLAKPKTSDKPRDTLPSSTPTNVLRERLGKHRSDMWCAVGEAEEYESLCNELPELSDKAQMLYNEARERSALLLGKIKALESLLSSDQFR